MYLLEFNVWAKRLPGGGAVGADVPVSRRLPPSTTEFFFLSSDFQVLPKKNVILKNSTLERILV